MIEYLTFVVKEALPGETKCPYEWSFPANSSTSYYRPLHLSLTRNVNEAEGVKRGVSEAESNVGEPGRGRDRVSKRVRKVRQAVREAG